MVPGRATTLGAPAWVALVALALLPATPCTALLTRVQEERVLKDVTVQAKCRSYLQHFGMDCAFEEMCTCLKGRWSKGLGACHHPDFNLPCDEVSGCIQESIMCMREYEARPDCTRNEVETTCGLILREVGFCASQSQDLCRYPSPSFPSIVIVIIIMSACLGLMCLAVFLLSKRRAKNLQTQYLIERNKERELEEGRYRYSYAYGRYPSDAIGNRMVEEHRHYKRNLANGTYGMYSESGGDFGSGFGISEGGMPPHWIGSPAGAGGPMGPGGRGGFGGLPPPPHFGPPGPYGQPMGLYPGDDDGSYTFDDYSVTRSYSDSEGVGSPYGFGSARRVDSPAEREREAELRRERKAEEDRQRSAQVGLNGPVVNIEMDVQEEERERKKKRKHKRNRD